MKKVMQQALDALMPHKSTVLRWYTPVDAAIVALQAAIDAAEPEPVAWISDESCSRLKKGGNDSKGTVPIHAKKSWASTTALYLHPPSTRDYGQQCREGALMEAALQVEQHKEIQSLTTALNQKVKLSEWEELVADNERKDAALRVALDALRYLDCTADHRVDPKIPDAAMAAIEEALK